MKTSRRSFLSTTAAATVPLSLKAEEKLFSVGLIADAQYVDANPGGIRHYKESIRMDPIHPPDPKRLDFSP